MSNAVLLVSRIFLVILFITGGFGFAANPGGIAGWFGSIAIALLISCTARLRSPWLATRGRP
jgi:uncharacterized membrane protein YphA (DoxX/SURF4 family)